MLIPNTHFKHPSIPLTSKQTYALPGKLIQVKRILNFVTFGQHDAFVPMTRSNGCWQTLKMNSFFLHGTWPALGDNTVHALLDSKIIIQISSTHEIITRRFTAQKDGINNQPIRVRTLLNYWAQSRPPEDCPPEEKKVWTAGNLSLFPGWGCLEEKSHVLNFKNFRKLCCVRWFFLSELKSGF